MKNLILESMVFTGLFFFNLIGTNYKPIEKIEIAGREVFIPEKLGNIKLYKDDCGFHIFKDGKIYDVKNYFCDPLLQKMSDDQLLNFLGRDNPKIIFVNLEDLQINPDDIVEVTGNKKDILINQLFGGGYISVNQMNDGEYILRAKIRLPGGVWGIRVGIIVGAIIGVPLGGGYGGIPGAVVGGAVGGAAGAGVGFVGEKIGERVDRKIGELRGDGAALRGEEYGREVGGVGAVAGAVVGAIVLGGFGPYGAVGGAALGMGVGGAVGGAAGGLVAIIVGDGNEASPVHDEENPDEHRPSVGEKPSVNDRGNQSAHRFASADQYKPTLTELFCC